MDGYAAVTHGLDAGPARGTAATVLIRVVGGRTETSTPLALLASSPFSSDGFRFLRFIPSPSARPNSFPHTAVCPLALPACTIRPPDPHAPCAMRHAALLLCCCSRRLCGDERWGVCLFATWRRNHLHYLRHAERERREKKISRTGPVCHGSPAASFGSVRSSIRCKAAVCRVCVRVVDRVGPIFRASPARACQTLPRAHARSTRKTQDAQDTQEARDMYRLAEIVVCTSY